MTAELGMSVWSKTRMVDADAYSCTSAGGYILDDYVNGDGEMVYVTVQPFRGQPKYHHIVQSDLAANPQPVNVKYIRSMADTVAKAYAEHRTDQHLDALMVLSRVLAKHEPQKAGR